MVAATPQMCWDVSIACGKCVGGGFYLDACLDLAQDSKCLHE